MDRVSPDGERGMYNSVNFQITFTGPWWTNANRPVGKPRGDRVAIRFRSREHGFDAELAARPNDSHCDLASIRDQDAADLHG
jgi:hypothetical protein